MNTYPEQIPHIRKHSLRTALAAVYHRHPLFWLMAAEVIGLALFAVGGFWQIGNKTFAEAPATFLIWGPIMFVTGIAISLLPLAIFSVPTRAERERAERGQV